MIEMLLLHAPARSARLAKSLSSPCPTAAAGVANGMVVAAARPLELLSPGHDAAAMYVALPITDGAASAIQVPARRSRGRFCGFLD